MAHVSRWFIDKRVLYIQYTGIVEKEELHILNEELTAYLDEGEQPIHIITDQSDMDKLNADLKSLRNNLSIMNDSRWGWIMIVGADPITQFFGKLVSHAFRKQVRIVKTLEEAKYALGVEDPRLAEVFGTLSGKE